MGRGYKRVGFRNIPSVLLSAVFLLDSQAIAFEFTGQVVSILDRDTLEVLHNQRPERIRLSDKKKVSGTII